MEAVGQMGLAGKSYVQCNLNDWHLGGPKQDFGPFESPRGEVPMRRQSGSGPERTAEMITTQTGLAGELAQRQLLAEISLDAVADPSQGAAREFAARLCEFGRLAT